MSVVSGLKQSPERTKAGASHPLCYKALAPAAETTLVSGSKSARVRAEGKGRDGGSPWMLGRKVGKGERRAAALGGGMGRKKEKKGGKRRNCGGKVHVGEVNSSGGFSVPAAPVHRADAGTGSLPCSPPLRLSAAVAFLSFLVFVCLFVVGLYFFSCVLNARVRGMNISKSRSFPVKKKK